MNITIRAWIATRVSEENSEGNGGDDTSGNPKIACEHVMYGTSSTNLNTNAFK